MTNKRRAAKSHGEHIGLIDKSLREIIQKYIVAVHTISDELAEEIKSFHPLLLRGGNKLWGECALCDLGLRGCFGWCNPDAESSCLKSAGFLLER